MNDFGDICFFWIKIIDKPSVLAKSGSEMVRVAFPPMFAS